MVKMATKNSTIRRLLAPILVERRDENALTDSKCTTKKRIRQSSASPSADVTSQSFSGAK